MKLSMAFAVLGINLLARGATAQTLPAPAARPTAPETGRGAYNFDYRTGLLCGAGASHDGSNTGATLQCAALLGMGPFEFETGAMGPQISHSAVSGYLSTDLWFPLMSRREDRGSQGVLLIGGGYTRLFETGSGLNYGVAYAHPVDSSHSIRFDVRDDWVFSNPHQHNVVFRLVWMVGLPD